MKWVDYAGTPPSVVGRLGVRVDTTGDGLTDAIGYDTTGDGFVDALDTSGDGRIDTAIVSKPAPTQTSYTGFPLHDYLDEDDRQSLVSRAEHIFSIIDKDSDGQISKLELLAAVVRNQTVDDFVVPGMDCSKALKEEKGYEAVSTVFDVIGGGKRRISRAEFVDHFRTAKNLQTDSDTQAELKHLRTVFDAIDASGKGYFSNFDLLGALQRIPEVASLLLPGLNRHQILSDEVVFDTANAVWDSISIGRRSISFPDFVEYFRKRKATCAQVQTLQQPSAKLNPMSVSKDGAKVADAYDTPSTESEDRSRPTLLQSLRLKRDKTSSKPVNHHHKKARNETFVLIISPGFGRELNPAQAALVLQAGFQVQYVDVPNPELPGFNLFAYLPYVKDAIDKFRPDVLVSASKGNMYVVTLWETGFWKGPTLMLNVPPQLRQLPRDSTVVIAHGSNDELYTWSRADLERLVATGSGNKCFLYYTANSGHYNGGLTRRGDMHNMASLLQYDCLPRLIDSAACESGPEMHMICSWRQRISRQRNEAEQWLTHCPEQLRNLWVSTDHMGMDSRKVYEVLRGSEEYSKVATIFKSSPPEPASYLGTSDAEWERTCILKVERVENGLLEQSENAYYECLRTSIEGQGLTFEPGVHTRWAFHGTDQVDSIVEDPMTGFQPLACGTRLGTVWGSGTYFARDARYVVDGNFCPQRRDGSRQMLLCLLMIGMPCLGDPNHHGVLPFRRKPHRYNSSVDSLSSPEIFITQHPGAAYPAYLITFI
jgi:hypothetical protein